MLLVALTLIDYICIRNDQCTNGDGWSDYVNYRGLRGIVCKSSVFVYFPEIVYDLSGSFVNSFLHVLEPNIDPILLMQASLCLRRLSFPG